jgi:membrane fusion protein (multidrug efflux system)
MTRLNPALIKIKFLLPILMFLAVSCKSKKDESKNGKRPPAAVAKVDGFIVAPQAVAQNIEVPGSLTPFEEADIHPEISGKVTGIFFNEGTNVGKGSLLVKLYDADLQAQIKKLQVQLSIAGKTEQRQSELLAISGISQQDYDLSLLSVNNIRADINILRTSISKTEIRAPFSGRLGLRNISTGAYVTPQTIITTLRQTNRLKLDFTVPEKYGTRMQNGALVYFSIDGSNKSYLAKVIANENDISQETRSLRVKAIVDKADEQLLAGAFARVKIMLDKNEAALMIPSQAVIPQARNKKVMVYRNGLASMETITTGIRDSLMVEVTSGLKSGDTILTTGLLTTKSGAKVQINKTSSQSSPSGEGAKSE